MPVGWAIAVIVLFVAVVALAVIVLGLLRQVTPVLERAAAVAGTQFDATSQGPAVGAPLPYFSAHGPDGEVTGEALLGQPAVLLFLSTGCGPCEALAAEMSRADLDGLGSRLVVITTARDPGELGIPARLPVLTEENRAVSRALSVLGTPFAVAVDRAGIVRAVSVPNTVRQLADLASQLESA